MSNLNSRLIRPISAITAYDYPSARICDESGIQIILVGDSLGMVFAGHEDTTYVKLDHMIYHTEIVKRAVKKSVIISDLPINTYRTSDEALKNSNFLIKAGADAVKLEGGGKFEIDKIKVLRDNKIEVCGHIGMMPQKIKEIGKYRKFGKSKYEEDYLIQSAFDLENAGVFALILESIDSEVARNISDKLSIPTIGIGSGDFCKGKIAVLHDIIGAYPWFVPSFAKTYGNVSKVIESSVKNYINDVDKLK